MSLVDDALTEGRTEMKAVAGIDVAFRRANVPTITVTVTIDRSPGFGSQDSNRRDLSEVETSRIMLTEDQVEEAPKVGQSFVESNGTDHRILRVTRPGDEWLCDCKVSRPA